MRSGRSKRRLFEQLEERLALATYYVSNQGNDNQNGSSGTPWLTLQKAADTVGRRRHGDRPGRHLRRLRPAPRRHGRQPRSRSRPKPASLINQPQRAHARRHQPGRGRLRDDRGVRSRRHAAGRHPLGAQPPRHHPQQPLRPQRPLGHLHRLQRRTSRSRTTSALARPSSTASTSPTAATARWFAATCFGAITPTAST